MDYTQLNAYENSGAQRRYRFQASAELTLAFLEQEFSGFLNPHPLVQTAGRQPNTPLLAVIAVWQGQTVGLIGVEALSPHHGLVICWHVLETHRGFGLGQKLLLKMQRFAQQNALSNLVLGFREDASCRQQINKILKKMHWDALERDLILYKFLPKLFIQMDWPRRIKLPKDYALFNWNTVSEQDVAYIKTELSEQIPASLSPFIAPTNFNSETSMGLRYQDKVIGWLLTHKVHADVIEYSRLYVTSDRQQLGRGIHLIIEAVKRQHALGLSRGIFQVQTQNTAMKAFAEYRMQSCITAKTGHVVSKKALTNKM